MKILTVGTVVKDIIHHFDGTISQSLGGLTYTIQALLSVVEAQDIIIPVSYVGEDIYEQILELYNDKQQILTDGFVSLYQPNNDVELTYTNPVDRQEHSKHPFPELPFSAIEPFLSADMLLLNMISGWDVSLKTMQDIREHFAGLISVDLHSLTLGRREDGLRYLRPVDVSGWFENCDIIQANEQEYKTLGGDPEKPEFFLRNTCFKGRKIFNLTRAFNGSSTFYFESGEIKRIDVPPPPNLKVVDPTGCGDAFMAGFIIDYYRNGDVKSAATAANKIAAYTGTFKGMAEH